MAKRTLRDRVQQILVRVAAALSRTGAKFASSAALACGAQLVTGGDLRQAVTVEHTYHFECWGPCKRCGVGLGLHGEGGDPLACDRYDGDLRWEDTVYNLVVTAGLNKYLDATLKTGLTTPAWFVGLVDGPGSGTTYAAGDTMGSHAGWTEITPYSNANRPAFTPGTIASGAVDNSASKAVFNINAADTVAGAFLADNNTKGGTTGTLLGEGDFSGGDKVVGSGDTLNVTVTCTITAS